MTKIAKVLLIDDEDDICSIVKACLTALAGWNILVEHSGEDAVPLAAREKPDVILVDVMLPGIDGIATFQRLRDQPATAQIPVIFMTAKVQKHELSRYLSLGAAGVICKPFDPMTLPQQIRARLDAAAGALS